MKKIKFLTSNKHKFEELEAFFHRSDFQNLKIRFEHLNQQYTELQADTIKEVAVASASSVSTILNEDFVLEDSGISINVLNGFPGPYSSYIYQTIGWQGILDIMRTKEERSALFTSVFVLSLKNELHVFEGITQGVITDIGRGDSGFGFDPIFIPLNPENPSRKTLAEMNMNEKNKNSHRGKSLSLLKQFLENLYSN